MIPSTYVTSSPIKTFYKLFYTHSDILDLKKEDRLISRAKELSGEQRFQKIMEKYKLLEDSFFNNLEVFKGKTGIILDFENLLLKNKQGFIQKECVDDFYSLTLPAKSFIEIDNNLEIPEDFVFLRLSPYDFPFQVRENKIINPLREELENINSILLERKKSGFNNGVREFNDIEIEESYKTSISSFSIQKFNSLLDTTNGKLTLEKVLKEYDENLDLDEFIKLNHQAIRYNREIIKKKYEILDDKLNESYLFMTENSVGKTLLKDKEVIGTKLLKNTKNLPTLNILEPQALNRLSGWISAKYKKKPFIIKTEKFIESFNPQETTKYHGIYSLNPAKTQEEIDFKIDELTKDMQNYNFGIYGIELILLRLNFENFKVFTDNGEISWEPEKIIEPFDLTNITKESKNRIIRPSNIGVKCAFNKYLNMLNFESENDFSRSGNSLHKISNEINDEQYKFLEKFNIPSMKREKYCEIPLTHEFKPSIKDYELAISKIDYKGNFKKRITKKIEEMINNETIILDGGRTDAMLKSGEIPIVVDFKRRMSTYYPVNYFFKQASRYGMALNSEEFYTVIVQTPYSANKFLGYTLDDIGEYRKQKLKIRKVSMQSDFIKNLKAEVILEYAGNSIFFEDSSLGKEFKNSKLCPKCFSKEICDDVLYKKKKTL